MRGGRGDGMKATGRADRWTGEHGWRLERGNWGKPCALLDQLLGTVRDMIRGPVWDGQQVMGGVEGIRNGRIAGVNQSRGNGRD